MLPASCLNCSRHQACMHGDSRPAEKTDSLPDCHIARMSSWGVQGRLVGMRKPGAAAGGPSGSEGAC